MKNSKTKYLILVGDGMADFPLEELHGKTPLEAAHTPNMDRIATCRIGRVRTIPNGMEPGSDIANLSILGYDPKKYHTGRAPLEAASMGISLKPNQIAYRMNLVTLDQKTENEVIMVSHSAGEIGTEEAEAIIDRLKEEMPTPQIALYPGVAYRHLMIWDDGPVEAVTIPPHDVLGQNMAPYLNHSNQNPVPRFIRRSWPILSRHEVNVNRRKKGLLEANSVWPWGQGKAPVLPMFRDRFGLDGGVISAVDLIKGIGITTGLEAIHVEGATGFLDTNYEGKAREAIEALDRLDFIFLHVEAPDEASHNGNTQDKIRAIEDFDSRVIGRIMSELTAFEDYRLMVISDHYTPISKRTHTEHPTLFAWASKEELGAAKNSHSFSEESARKSPLFFDPGHELIQSFLFERPSLESTTFS